MELPLYFVWHNPREITVSVELWHGYIHRTPDGRISQHSSKIRLWQLDQANYGGKA